MGKQDIFNLGMQNQNERFECSFFLGITPLFVIEISSLTEGPSEKCSAQEQSFPLLYPLCSLLCFRESRWLKNTFFLCNQIEECLSHIFAVEYITDSTNNRCFHH